MSDNLMEKVSALGERLKIGGTEMGRKMTAGMTSMSFKMKELFQGQNQAEKVVDEATAETLEEPDWAANLEICDMINTERINSVELIRGIKKRIVLKNPRVQYLALVLLETCVKNCEKAFSEVAAERVLDEMVKLIDDPQTVVNNRNKALILIEAWGESASELRYLPVYEETYKVFSLETIVLDNRYIWMFIKLHGYGAMDICPFCSVHGVVWKLESAPVGIAFSFLPFPIKSLLLTIARAVWGF